MTPLDDNGVDCLANLHFYDVDPDVYLHAQPTDAYNLRNGKDGIPDNADDWVIFDGALDMFPDVINHPSLIQVLLKIVAGKSLL